MGTVIYERDNRSIAQIAVDVHSTTTGSFVRDDENQERDIEALKMKLARWEPSSPKRCEQFDNCVKALVRMAITEAECWPK
jgi:hypothetical protein